MSEVSSPPPPPPTLPRRAPWVALGTMVVVLLLGSRAHPYLEAWQQRRHLAELWPRLRACLGGDGGRLEDATLRARVIRAEIDPDAPGTWPRRCLPLTAKIEGALYTAWRVEARCDGACCATAPHCASISRRRHQLARAREQIRTRRFEGGVVAALLASPPVDAADAAREVATPAEVTAPPAPIVLMPPPPALSPGGYDRSALRLGAAPTLLLHRRGHDARLCGVDVARAIATCRPLPPSMPTAGDVLLVDGAPRHPLHVLVRPDDDPAPVSWRVYDRFGRARLDLRHGPIGVTVDAAGPKALVVDRGATFLIASGDTAPQRWPPLSRGGPPLVWGDHVYTVAGSGVTGSGVTGSGVAGSGVAGSRELRLRRHRLDGRIDAEVTLPLPDSALALTACGDVAVLAAVDDGIEDRAAIIFSPPDGPLTAHRVTQSSRWAGLTCDAGRPPVATLTWTEVAAGVHRMHRCHCRADEGCGSVETTTLTMARLPGTRTLAASLDPETLAYVWQSRQGDIRAHIGPGGGPLRAHVIADDAARGGLDWGARPVDLLAGRGFAILLAHGADGASGYLLDRDGVRPLRPGTP
ncbi:MAG: hypothetical protein AAGN82_21070 [Myxococcota bacterium]